MNCQKLVVGDGSMRMWGRPRIVYSDAKGQGRVGTTSSSTCWTGFQRGSRQADAAEHPACRVEYERLKSVSARWCREHPYYAAAGSLQCARMVPFYDFPDKHCNDIMTTNVEESPYAELRLRTDAARRYGPRMVAEGRFRRLSGPDLTRTSIRAQSVRTDSSSSWGWIRAPPDHVYTIAVRTPLSTNLTRPSVQCFGLPGKGFVRHLICSVTHPNFDVAQFIMGERD